LLGWSRHRTGWERPWHNRWHTGLGAVLGLPAAIALELTFPDDEQWNAGWPEGGMQLSQSAVERARSLEGCIVLAQDADQSLSYTRRSLDAELGLIRELPLEPDGTSKDPPDPNQSHALYWRWDDHGRLVMKAGGGSGYRPFRHSFERDERGNVTAFRFTYSDALDLDAAPKGELYMATYYRNSYGSDGLLSEHRVERTEGAGADLSQTLTYQHDERGRCQRIESSSARGVEIEQREYDEADRLKRSTRDVTIALLQGPASAPIQIVQTLHYDDQGRLSRSESDGEAGFSLATADGTPDEFMRTRYYADGSKLIESLGFTGDVRGDPVERGGVQEYAWHHFEFWSAGCQEVDATVPVPAGLACSSDY
jgi:hypothetical protein